MEYFWYQPKELLDFCRLDGCALAFALNSSYDLDIGLPFQQHRAMNLAFALQNEHVVNDACEVAVVGGSFSGLYMAVALALQKTCIVHVFEKAQDLLPNQKTSFHRLMHRNVNSRQIDPRWGLGSPVEIYSGPIFKWEDGLAVNVRHDWLQEFSYYQRLLPIFCHTEWSFSKFEGENKNRISLSFTVKGGAVARRTFDAAIFCTGFGAEANPFNVSDYSYWTSGSQLFYTNKRLSAKPRSSEVLISGNGDSGAIEVYHHLIPGFEHEHLPGAVDLSPVALEVQRGVNDSLAFEILDCQESERFGNKIAPALVWLLDQKLYEESPEFTHRLLSDMPEAVRPIASQIYEKLLSSLIDIVNGFGHSWQDEADLEHAALNLSRLSVRNQNRLVASIKSDLNRLFSTEFLQIINKIEIGRLSRCVHPSMLEVSGASVTLNGLTPFPFSMSTSLPNNILLAVYFRLGYLKYRAGRIASVEERNTSFLVTFEEGDRVEFDHFACRYGTQAPKTIGPAVHLIGSEDPVIFPMLASEASSDTSGGSRLQPAKDKLNSAICHLIRGTDLHPTCEPLVKDRFENLYEMLHGTQELDSLYQSSLSRLLGVLRESKRPAIEWRKI